MIIESTLGRDLVVSRNKAGGSAAETIYIELPRTARVISYFAVIEGAGNALQCALAAFGDYADGTVDVAQANSTNLFSFTATNSAQGGMGTTAGGNFLRWIVQANAATANEFCLHLKFYGA